MSDPSQRPESPATPARPPRRPRYAGRNPRRFEDKYKEHDPQRYARDVARIIASGKTPAGTHIPIMVAEILEVLQPKPGDVAVDCTIGHGGHARELLARIEPGGCLIGLDVDPIELPKTEARLRQASATPETVRIERSNFAGLPQVLARAGIAGADLVLADLGVSSMQIDDPRRGFTYKADGPLDLRMNPERGQPASALIASLEVAQMAGIFAANADEPRATLLAEFIHRRARSSPIRTTTALAGIIRDALGARSREEIEACIRRVFQALRIEVNDEFGALDAFLRVLPSCLNPGGRVAILTFHSGEDRRVKKSFQAEHSRGSYIRIADEVIRPGPAELRANPRSSSAKLRWAVRA